MSPQGISQRFGSVALSLVLAATILTLSPTAASTPDTDASSPALETFRVQKVIDFDLPAGVVAGSADLSPDAEHLLLEVEIDGQTQIAVTDLEGRNYQCVSCGATGNATKALALQDNKRIWFADTSGQQSGEDPSSGGTGTINYAVLECGPSIYDCQQRSVKKVKFPSDRRNLPAQNREAKPRPVRRVRHLERGVGHRRHPHEYRRPRYRRGRIRADRTTGVQPAVVEEIRLRHRPGERHALL